MLTESRRRRLDLPRSLSHDEWGPRVLRGADGGMLYLDKVTSIPVLRAFDHVLRGLHDAVDQAPSLMSLVEGLELAPAQEGLSQRFAELTGALNPSLTGGESLLQQPGLVQEVGRRVPVGASEGDGHGVAVPGLHRLYGDVAGILRLPPPSRAHVAVQARRVPESRRDRLLNRNVDPISLTGELLAEHRCHDGGGRVGPSPELGLIQGVFEGLAPVGAKDVHQPAQGVLHNLRRLVVSVGAGLTEARDRGHDDVRFDLSQGVVPEAQGGHHAGAEALHDHVGAL